MRRYLCYAPRGCRLIAGKGGVIGIYTFDMQGFYHVISLTDEVRALKIDNITTLSR
jgi:hypothetical protein